MERGTLRICIYQPKMGIVKNRKFGDRLKNSFQSQNGAKRMKGIDQLTCVWSCKQLGR